MVNRVISALLLGTSLAACAKPYPGPDKQFVGEVTGAASGAGAGAVTGFQLGVGTGPGAFVGAGLGAVAGGIEGFSKDEMEEDLLRVSAQTRIEREKAYVHEILNDHYRRRMELHPSRDIFPADLFFYGDEADLKMTAKGIVTELARLNKERVPWSRLIVAVYVKSTDPESFFAKHLAEKRSKAICNQLIRAGLEPRRVEGRAVVIDAPVLIDPDDRPGRYNQAIELIPADR